MTDQTALKQIDLDEDEALTLASYISAGKRPVTLVVSDGRAGYGLYAFDTEYPDEGAEFIAALDATPQPAPQAPRCIQKECANRTTGCPAGTCQLAEMRKKAASQATIWYVPDDNGQPFATTGYRHEAQQWHEQGKTVISVPVSQPAPSLPLSDEAMEDPVMIPRELIAAACYVVRKHAPESTLLKKLREYTIGAKSGLMPPHSIHQEEA
jgi:hypothetical protein